MHNYYWISVLDVPIQLFGDRRPTSKLKHASAYIYIYIYIIICNYILYIYNLGVPHQPPGDRRPTCMVLMVSHTCTCFYEIVQPGDRRPTRKKLCACSSLFQMYILFILHNCKAQL